MSWISDRRRGLSATLPLVLFATTVIAGAERALPRVAPAEVGMRHEVLEQITPAVIGAIEQGQLPGCVVLIGRRGKVAYCQAFGNRQIEPAVLPMDVSTVFDLASLTKPIVTATGVMILVDRGQLEIDAPAARYWPEFASHGKESITLKDLLTHRSGLIPDNPLSDYQPGPAEAWSRIANLKPRAAVGERFQYSDVGFLVLGKVIEQVTSQPLDDFARREIFDPLEMNETGFLPAFELRERAAPTTQREGKWIQGEVHDPRASLLGGVAGHAGLFSTADDLALYAAAMARRGHPAQQTLFADAAWVQMTESVAVPGGRRTLGWDRDTAYSINRGSSLSVDAFGHGGFTGTALWIDPAYDLFVIFLSNRLHPDGKGSVNRLAGQICDLAVASITDEGAEDRSANIDFDAAAWLKQRDLALIDLQTPQSGRPLRGLAATTLDEWTAERELYRRAFVELIGHWPEVRPGLQTRVLERHEEPHWTRYKVGFQSLSSASPRASEIRAWLLIPKRRPAPLPAIITLHQTVPQGKDEPAGLQTTLPWLAFASYYAERGYVTLAPDMIGYGERTTGGLAATGFEAADAAPILEAHSDLKLSILGLMLFDITRCVDFLETRREVDRQRIGIVGHSQGGFLTNMVLGLEPRLAVGAASCGYGIFRYDAEFRSRWCDSRSAYLPRMHLYRDQPQALPVDFLQIMALAAPRPHLIQTAMGDTIWTLPGVASDPLIRSELRRVRSLYGPEWAENFLAIQPHCGSLDANHGWYPEMQQAADALFERVLNPSR